MRKDIKKVCISGKDVWPIIEGGKGIGISDGKTSGAFAAAGAVGTFSGANAKLMDDNGEYIPLVYRGKTRRERHDELIEYSIKGAISQARIAHNISNGCGRIHMNVLWEMGGIHRILHGVLEGAKGLIHGITCGAGMPYKLAEIASQYQVYYYPIVSSMRAFKILWTRAYKKISKEWLGGVVYEDPWLAGGHNGLSNSESPDVPQEPFDRVAEIRSFMNEVGLSDTILVMAGGVWHLKDWELWFNNDLVGPIAFQFGTRPLVTQESPISLLWKKRLLTLKKGDVFLNRFSPTGFYSSAVKNDFINELQERNERQISFKEEPNEEFCVDIVFGSRGRKIYIKPCDKVLIDNWVLQGYTEMLKTPDDTLIFVTKEKSHEIREDQINCMGCLSHCRFSNWKDHGDYNTGNKPDSRSFCIQKTLQNIINGKDHECELMFSGHNAYRFSSDSFYKDGYIPTIKELVNRILTGY
ncbi:nitronate monooxygenase [Neoehrlichia mikurensis]|uniref:Nitronate monooxygenase n=1 Tax=Neoehrlichia mikurensis TaxID=89586 RepID=A0A9Q9C013_9RICK|nr:nitronate monooxygenase [Neoehrlichia mikurensis]QXK92398.1 nitronate monooxygenase [Neoehrlichia mikurensis]QXK93245.1 nitronate monooxygenase [Neoehrlichia mikurensis]QXK94089.1 nitronate monooxygenase [Neoehrlichia mikurensis]UTO55674.1 nitronate monooxygenase [Neoehrlichia mikurensis]UTO56592.1 nitronate monooxygenase [Neoehrlichia mikurensis]